MKSENYVVLECGIKVPYYVVVRQDKGRVVAIADDCSTLGLEACGDAFHSIDNIELQNGCRLMELLLMDDVYSAKAQLHEEDEHAFCPKLGAKIAAQHLKEKLDRAVANRKRMLGKELAMTALRLGIAFVYDENNDE